MKCLYAILFKGCYGLNLMGSVPLYCLRGGGSDDVVPINKRARNAI